MFCIMSPLELRKELSYEESAMKILDSRVKQLKNKTVDLVKVLWNHHGLEEATWELRSEMERKYPHLFVDP